VSKVWQLPEPPDIDALREAYTPDRSRPGLRMNFVTSLDGAVEVDGHSRGLSSDADRLVFFILRAHADAVMVGAGTLRHEGYGPLRLAEPAQAWRRSLGLPDNPTLVIVSGSLDLDPATTVFTDAPVRPVVLTHAAAPAERRGGLEPVADVIALGDATTDLRAGLAELRRRGLAQILCEGGPRLFGTLFADGLVDELCMTISPLLAGPGSGRIIAGQPDGARLSMRLVHVIAAGSDLLTRYASTTA
jgi:riboflavin biosynthesis pyrimidine reductase